MLDYSNSIKFITYAVRKLPYNHFVLLLLRIQIWPSINELQVKPWIHRSLCNRIVKTVREKEEVNGMDGLSKNIVLDSLNLLWSSSTCFNAFSTILTALCCPKSKWMISNLYPYPVPISCLWKKEWEFVSFFIENNAALGAKGQIERTTNGV